MAVQNGVITNTTLGSAKVTVDILSGGRCIPNRNLKSISYITIHDTGNTAPAKNQHNYLKNNNRGGSNPKASWHFSVDDTQIIQAVRTDKEAWHAGHRTGNGYGIGIEISQRTNGEAQRKAYLNAIALVKVLQNAYKIPDNKVVRHKDWTGKDCPYMMNHSRYGLDWSWFKKQLASSTSVPAADNKKVVDTVIVYEGEVDEVAAKILQWKKTKSLLVPYKDMNKYKPKHIFAVGGIGAKYPNADKILRGANRYETVKEVMKYIGK